MILPLLLAALAAPAPAGPEKVGFDEAVRRALARSPAALVARDEIARVDGLLGQARAGSFPSLVATGAVTVLDHERTLAGRTTQAKETWQEAATLAVPVLAPARWATWAAARAALDATRASELDVRRQVALAAGRAYLGVLAGRRAVEVGRSAVDLARARLDFARARQQAGVGNALDVARAEQALAGGEALLEAARTGLARAREALGVATGGEGPVDAADEPALAAPADPRGAEERRADVAAARARLEALATAARLGWTEWLPSLLATAQATATQPAIAPAQPEAWQAQLVLSLPLFEGGRSAGAQREREALEREARTALDATLRQARSDLRLSAEAVGFQEQALAAARRAAAQARTVLELVTRAAEAGAVGSLEVIDAQTRARDAELAAVIAEDGARQARLDLLAAAGLFP